MDLAVHALRSGTELHEPSPFSRWDSEQLYNPGGGVGKVSSRIGTYVHSAFAFDQDAFGLSPNESALMDPQQRVLLEETVKAFHSAGHSIAELAGSNTGVYVGCIWLEYGEMLAKAGVPAGAYMVTGTYIANKRRRAQYIGRYFASRTAVLHFPPNHVVPFRIFLLQARPH